MNVIFVQNKNKKEKKAVPLELKTGKPSYSLEHKGQVTLYSMMTGDRRRDPEEGLLLYLKEPSMKSIPVDHVNKRGNISMCCLLADLVFTSLSKMRSK